MCTNGNDPAIALENDAPAGVEAVVLRLRRHQSSTFSLVPFGATALCVKSPSWMTNAGLSPTPTAYAGAGLGVSWSAKATNVNDRSCVEDGKVVKLKMRASTAWLISTAYEYVVSGSKSASAIWAASSWLDRVTTGAVAASRTPIP